jgi:UPF0716 family protein affecting phage T7 exclusion
VLRPSTLIAVGCMYWMLAGYVLTAFGFLLFFGPVRKTKRAFS